MVAIVGGEAWARRNRQRRYPRTYIAYLDSSGDEQAVIFSAVVVPVDVWRANFLLLKDFRKKIKASDGIRIRKELHAFEFVGGRGNYAPHIVSKERRAEIFFEVMHLTTTMNVRIFSACFPHGKDLIAFERLVNRLERTTKAWNGRMLLISDKEKEGIYTKMLRKMGVFNPIPSHFGQWDTGADTMNIPLERITEDIVFKDSKMSYFIQLVDFVAYAAEKGGSATVQEQVRHPQGVRCLGPGAVQEGCDQGPAGDHPGEL